MLHYDKIRTSGKTGRSSGRKIKEKPRATVDYRFSEASRAMRSSASENVSVNSRVRGTAVRETTLRRFAHTASAPKTGDNTSSLHNGAYTLRIIAHKHAYRVRRRVSWVRQTITVRLQSNLFLFVQKPWHKDFPGTPIPDRSVDRQIFHHIFDFRLTKQIAKHKP